MPRVQCYANSREAWQAAVEPASCFYFFAACSCSI